jgi:hypothetical protein
MRDLELKDVKIQSLEAIVQKREQSVDFSTLKLEEKLRMLELDKEKLIKDNVTLIRENEYLKEHLNVTVREEQEKFKAFNDERQAK